MNAPSKKSLVSLLVSLGCLETDAPLVARDIREHCHNGRPRKALHAMDRACDATHGVEYLRPAGSDSSPSRCGGGLYYVNTGETYATTLLYDARSGSVRIGDWGSVVESNPSRFE